MENRVLIDTNQKVDVDDFNNFGLYPQASLDHVVYDTILPDRAFTGFVCAKSAAARVLVGNGRFYGLGKVYYNDSQGGFEVDFITNLPPTTRRWAAITVWGTEAPGSPLPRTFLTDAFTRATEARVTATKQTRWANIGTVLGTIGPDPVRPIVPSDVIAVAYVLLDANGVVSIERNTDGVAPSVRGNAIRLDENDAWRTQAGTRLDTLGSDLAGLAKKIHGLASQNFVVDVAADLARTKRALRLPSTYVAWHADNFVDLTGSDPLHVDWLALVEEGVRFPDAAVTDAQLGLLNQFDPAVIQQNFFLLPAWTEFPRLSSIGNDAEQAISQYPFQTSNYTLRSKTRARWRYGPIVSVCTNAIFHWQSLGLGTYDPIAGIFRYTTGEVFEIIEEDRYRANNNHLLVRWRSVWFDGWENIDYWALTVQNLSASGSVIGQTFLNSQDGWLTSIDLGLTRVGSTGDLTVILCDVENGAPVLSSSIARVTVTQANLKTYPEMTNVAFEPTFLRAGKRYAIALVTPGNHYVALTVGNKFAQGTLFYVTDGAWAQGDLARDLCFRANFARFTSPRVTVQMNPLGLAGGIAAIDILAQAIIPPQCSIQHEILVSGVGWINLDAQIGKDGTTHALVGLPAQVSYRIVFIGTTDVMPGIGVGANSRTRTRRSRADFTHVSAIINHSSSGTIKHTVRLENWVAARHTYELRLLTGAGYTTVVAPTTTVAVAAPDDPTDAIIITATWSITAVTSHRLRIKGTTNNVLLPFHVAERVDVET